jgi:hypothetical protein
MATQREKVTAKVTAMEKLITMAKAMVTATQNEKAMAMATAMPEKGKAMATRSQMEVVLVKPKLKVVSIDPSLEAWSFPQ